MFHHLRYYDFFFNFLFVLFATKTIQLPGLMQFRFYNPEQIHAFRIIKFGNPQ